MHEVLLFRIYAALASFGTVAVGEQRPSQTHPAKSQVIGLVAAALGIRRDEEARLAQLANGLGMAVLQVADGSLLRDYHTAQVPSQSDLNKAPHSSRRDELRAAPRQELNTILSTRDYRCETVHVVALWRRAAELPTLAAIQAALEQPVFVPYVGRKSCPLSLPMAPQVVQADSLNAAFAAELAGFHTRWLQLNSGRKPSSRQPLSQHPTWLFWEDGNTLDPPAGLVSMQTHSRHDASLSRRRWQFGARLEHIAAWTGQEAQP